MKDREPRRQVRIVARMRAGAGWSDVMIQNMSSRGLMGRSRQICARGTVVEIRRAHHVIIGRVMWSEDGCFGVRTSDRIDIDHVIDTDAGARSIASDPTSERRREPTVRLGPSVRAERSRAWGSAFQFAALSAACVGGAALIGYQVWAAVAAPMHAISAALAGR